MTQALTAASPGTPGALRRRAAPPPGIVLVGASTGGPQALVVLVASLRLVLDRLPVCVTLHLPSDLMPVIAAHVARTCRVPTDVVTADRRLDTGTVYFSPGERHLTFERFGASIGVVLAPATPGEFCRPAVDVMFKSGALSHGAAALGVVLSGMGKDGLEGARAIVAKGGKVLVQDKHTSAVWGMPGVVEKAGLAAAVLEPAAIGREIVLGVTRARKSA